MNGSDLTGHDLVVSPADFAILKEKLETYPECELTTKRSFLAAYGVCHFGKNICAINLVVSPYVRNRIAA